ncbi:MAG TPA: hypothetical protein ENK67_02595, partial [Flavobacteriia bacterium]|nr:hypothetical protein [Flavobacteriia bacterium]
MKKITIKSFLIPIFNAPKQLIIKTFLSFVVLVIFTNGYAQEVPFSVRYQNTFKGGVTYLANNVLSETATGNSDNPNGSNDLTIHVYVDVDKDSSTFNSSTA